LIKQPPEHRATKDTSYHRTVHKMLSVGIDAHLRPSPCGDAFLLQRLLELLELLLGDLAAGQPPAQDLERLVRRCSLGFPARQS